MLLCALFAAAGTMVYADEYAYIVFGSQDGTTSYLPATGTKIVFESGQMVATSGSESLTLTLTDLAYMAFTNDTGSTGISQLSTTAQGSSSQWFTLDGRAVTNSSSLMPGIYIVVNNGTPSKVVVR